MSSAPAKHQCPPDVYCSTAGCMNYVEVAIPFFILAMLVEFLYGKLVKRQTYRLADTVNSLQLGTLSRLVDVLRLGFSAMVFGALVQVARRSAVVDGFGVAVGRRVRRLRLLLLLGIASATSGASCGPRTSLITRAKSST